MLFHRILNHARTFGAALVLLILAGLFGSQTGAQASQGTGCLPTTGTLSGLTLVQDMNAALAALISSNSGSAAPTTDCTAAPIPGQLWLDTSVTPPRIRIYSGATGGWQVLGYPDSTNGVWTPPIGGGSATLASNSTVDLCSVPQSFVTITGTNTITSLNASCTAANIGQVKVLSFSGTLTLTYNAANLILPGGVNQPVTPGDIGLGVFNGTGWNLIAFHNADGTPVGATSAYANTLLSQLGATRGMITEYGVSGWTGLTPGSSGAVLTSNGPGADPSYQALNVVGIPAATGLKITNDATTPNSKVDITVGFVQLTNASNSAIVRRNLSLVINDAVTGTNGLDAGVIASSSWYYVWIIDNGTTSAGLLSLSSTSPTLPSGYTYSMRVGAMRTDGSNLLLRTIQYGSKANYQVTLSTNTAALPTIVYSTTPNISLTAYSVASVVPPTAPRALIGLYVYNTSSAWAAPNNQYGSLNYSANPPPCGVFGGVASQFSAQDMLPCDITLETPNIYFAWAASSGSSAGVFAIGWIDSVNAN